MNDPFPPSMIEQELERLRLEEFEQQQRDHEDALLDEFRHRTDWKPAKRVKRRDAPPASRLWRDTIVDRDGCVVHENPADCTWPPRAHHVVPQQLMRREGIAYLLWHPLAGVGVCDLAHVQHHSRHRPIRLEEIPVSVREFVTSHGFRWYLEKHYP